MAPTLLDDLAGELVLGALLQAVRTRHGEFEILDHWQQGEFHHDVVLRLAPRDAEAADGGDLPGRILVVATNCNGGVKEILAFDEVPTRGALWRFRCPTNPEFEGELPPLRGRKVTLHWFDPCDLLRPDARSELRAEFRERQAGGGWVYAGDDRRACDVKR